MYQCILAHLALSKCRRSSRDLAPTQSLKKQISVSYDSQYLVDLGNPHRRLYPVDFC